VSDFSKECQNCGQVFTVFKKNPNRLSCTDACSNRARQKRWYELHRQQKLKSMKKRRIKLQSERERYA
jgi:hypothetical protein